MSTTLNKIWQNVGPLSHGFAHNSLVSCLFLTRKVLNRSSHHALHIDQGVVSLVQLSVWSTVWSNLGQTWSILVKLGQTWSNLVKLGQNPPNSGKCAPDPILSFFWCGGPPSGRLGSVNILVKPGQTWLSLVNLGQTPRNAPQTSS